MREEHQENLPPWSRYLPSESWISALSALLALVFSIYVWYRADSLMHPTQRPIISLSDVKHHARILEDPPRFIAKIHYMMKNIGKHPAINLRVRLGGTVDPQRPNNFKMIMDTTSANRIDPDGQVGFSHTETQETTKENGNTLGKNNLAFLHVFVTYADAFDPSKKYYDEYWLEYETKDGAPSNASEQEKLILLPFVKKFYGEEYQNVPKY